MRLWLNHAVPPVTLPGPLLPGESGCPPPRQASRGQLQEHGHYPLAPRPSDLGT